MSSVNLILIGMPGTGKSTLGEGAAHALHLNFIDTDQIIQKMAGMSPQKVLDKGKDIFTDFEDKALRSCPRNNQLIATGGSAIYCKETLSIMKETSVIVHLVASLETLEDRIDNFDSRGIVMPAGMSFRDLYLQRMPLYEDMADVELKTDQVNPTLSILVQELVNLYKQKALIK